MGKKKEPAGSVPHLLHAPAIPGAYRLREATDQAEPTLALPIRLVDDTLPLPAYQSPGAAGFDLYARQASVIGAHTEALVPLNIVVQCPAGWGFFVIPRSSTLRTLGLMQGNSVGLVDSDFRGNADEVCFLAHNIRNVPVMIERGQRIAQGFLLPVPRITFVPITEDAPDRGGFGSTGTH